MERSTTSLNGRRAAVVERSHYRCRDSEKVRPTETSIPTQPQKTAPAVTPDRDLETDEQNRLLLKRAKRTLLASASDQGD